MSENLTRPVSSYTSPAPAVMTHRLVLPDRHRSSGPLGALLSSPALDVRLMTALQVLQVLHTVTW